MAECPTVCDPHLDCQSGPSVVVRVAAPDDWPHHRRFTTVWLDSGETVATHR